MVTPYKLTSCLPLLALACGGYREPPGGDEASDDNVSIEEGNNDASEEETAAPCLSDADCEENPNGSICDSKTGECYPFCIPGSSENCPEGLEQIGECKIGSRGCQPDGTWGACTNSVGPTEEDCNNGLDDDCDGFVDGADKDGDGFASTCANGPIDCCDEEIIECVNAHLVNPGAFEVPDNEVDDDCDGEIDELTETCDASLASDSSDPLDYAKALDLCQTTSADDPRWGVLGGSFALANHAGQPLYVQRSIREDFGAHVKPGSGGSMAALSSGHAAASDHQSPNFAIFEFGQDFNTSVTAPSDWLSANGNEFPDPCELELPPNTAANDSIMLSLTVRAPTNALSFSVDMYFYSAEFPEWICSEYNDFFITLLASDAENNPADHNIAVYDDGEKLWPIGVNILKASPKLFKVCKSGLVGCQGELPAFQYACEDGPTALEGTGFDLPDPSTKCVPDDLVGGATGWLTMNGNVEPGEEITVDFAVWDSGGHAFDSLVLLDNWQWSVEAASPGVIVK